MSQPSWTIDDLNLEETKPNRLKFVIAGIVLISLVGVLIFQGIRSEGQFFITIAEYNANPAKYADRDFRVSAWVDGDTIQFTQIDATTSRLEFDIVDDLANPTERMRIVAINEPLPDLLQHEAQAIVAGRIGADGSMYANPGDGLLLKCPTRYEEGETQASY